MNKPNKKYYIWVIVVFTASILIGYAVGASDLPRAQSFVQNAVGPAGFLNDLSAVYIFLLIFLNNAIKALLTLLLGFFFGLFTLYFVISNGFLIGLVVAMVSLTQGEKVLLAGTLPHGIFELPGIVIASAYGLWLGVKFYRRIAFNEKKEFGQAIKFSLSQYFRIIVPLLLVGAFVEAFITPILITYFSQ